MSLSSFIADLYSSLTITEVHAEAPPAEPEAEEAEPTKEEEPEAEEEEVEEPEDPMPALLEECEKTKECAPAKHHYDECVERVTAAAEDPNSKGPKEDCVEEFFHLMHCTTECAAPKLWAKLK
ncbi:ubiquinol-cytochrome c reductase subunit 6 [Sphaerosporella brunnea]|uniref:Cytochrome b-c1 complex subunit 6, mitochondrial n=1 Tax=Sphaerosporella brunnea TaxID=1250544 RepID=A0A5J5F2L1_9PEZI|nr:ubiquinol-cytochrome c reductase subunit 6 [Sphaerosporella brunnea]